jgi:predicted alpha/beta-hydrolase family hydrolase
MERLAALLGHQAIAVTRFEFPYMAKRRQGRRPPPDPMPRLEKCTREAVAEVAATLGGSGRLAIGGKSMGGRVASHMADELGVRALVCLGYPFHPPGRPERTRTAHLETLRTPTLIVQGDRDPFGGPADVAGYRLSDAIEIAWIGGAGHSLEYAKSRDALEEAAAKVARFLERLD